MELKDFNIFNLSLQQKKLLKKKVGQGGRNGNDEDKVDKAIFNISFPYVDGQSKVRFTLIAGKPKLRDIGYGDFELDAIFVDNYGCISYYYFSTYDIEFYNFSSGVLRNKTYRLSQTNEYIQQLNNLNVGEYLDIDENLFTITEQYSFYGTTLRNNKNFSGGVLFNSLSALNIEYEENNKTYYGKIIEDDKENHFLYVSIKNEIWKYSYRASTTMYNSITFVEVVSELT